MVSQILLDLRRNKLFKSKLNVSSQMFCASRRTLKQDYNNSEYSRPVTIYNPNIKQELHAIGLHNTLDCFW
jgi:hypothetical protein